MAETVLKPEVEMAMLGHLEGPADYHVRRSGGLLGRLPIDLDEVRHPGQSGSVVHGDIKDLEFIEGTAALVIKGFPKMADEMKAQSSEAIQETGEILKEGGNVIMATSHLGLIDPAIALGLVNTRLRRQGYEQFDSGISIGKMLSILGYRIGRESFPTVEVLKWICNDIYLSIPRTRTTKNSELGRQMQAEIKAQNLGAAGAMKRRLKAGGLLLAMSPSGTTDKPKDGKHVLEKLESGTIKIMTAENTHVLPVAVDLSEEDPFIEICDSPRQLTGPDQAHGIMHAIATRLNQRARGRRFEYEGPVQK